MFKVGDIITAYRSGYHRIVEINDRLITYQTIMRSDGKIVNGKSQFTCHECYCQKVDAGFIDRKLIEVERTYKNELETIAKLRARL